MSQWDSGQYLKFRLQRTQPAIDLARRIENRHPKSVLDIGCGPGNSTQVLKQMFPEASILGVDYSEDMIRKARESYPDMDFRLCDITSELDRLERYDVIFSNACLQWVPNHETLIPRLFDRLNLNGTLAVQMPMNGAETLFQIIDGVVSEPKWGFSSMRIEPNGTLTPEAYFDLLSSCTDRFDIWETVYYHSMPSVEAMMEWVKGTRLRPYLNVLDKDQAGHFEQEIAARAAKAYELRPSGKIIFKFRRFFFTATK